MHTHEQRSIRRPKGIRARARASAFPVLLVTISILIALHIFRIAHFLGFAYRCAPMEERWFESGYSGWPLFGYFALVFMMLFLLNAGLLTDRAVRSDRPAVVIVLFNAVALVALSVGLFAQLDTAALQYLDRHGGLKWIATARLDLLGPDTCDLSKPFLGRWRVVSRSFPLDSQQFPYAWVNLRRDLTFETDASRWFEADASRWSSSIAGNWGPPEPQWGSPMWFWTDRGGYSLWNATLSDTGQLILEVPPDQSRPAGRVQLARFE